MEIEMARSRGVLYIGTNRHVAAIDARTGEEIWRTKLPHSTGIVTLLLKGRQVFVGVFGHVYCLNKQNGEIVWKNGMPKMGYQPVLLAMEGSVGSVGGDVAAADAERRRSAGAGSAGSYS